jgi:hypothetical protein
MMMMMMMMLMLLVVRVSEVRGYVRRHDGGLY